MKHKIKVQINSNFADDVYSIQVRSWWGQNVSSWRTLKIGDFSRSTQWGYWMWQMWSLWHVQAMVKVWSEMELRISVYRAKTAFRERKLLQCTWTLYWWFKHLRTLIKESTHVGKQAGLFRIKFGSILTKVGPLYRKQMLRNDLQSNSRWNDSWTGTNRASTNWWYGLGN